MTLMEPQWRSLAIKRVLKTDLNLQAMISLYLVLDNNSLERRPLPRIEDCCSRISNRMCLILYSRRKNITTKSN